MSPKQAAVLTSILSLLLLSLTRMAQELPRITVGGDPVNLEPPGALPNQLVAEILPLVTAEAEQALTMLATFNRAGTALMNLATNLLKQARERLVAENVRAREANHGLMEELDRNRRETESLKKDLNSSLAVENQLLAQCEQLRTERDDAEEEHANKYRKL